MALWRHDLEPGAVGVGSVPDDGGAGDLADQLDRLAAAWEAGAGRRWAAAALARRTWRGPSAAEFDQEMERERDGSDQLAQLLRAEARAWRTAAEVRLNPGTGTGSASTPGWRP